MNPGTLVTRIARFLTIPLFLVALFSDFLSTNPPDRLDLNQCYAPPSRIHFRDPSGKFRWRPQVYRMEMTDIQLSRYGELTDQSYPLRFFPRGFPYRILGIIPSTRHFLGTDVEGIFHPWGTDGMGRDVFSRTLAGARTSLFVLIVGIVLYAFLGTAIGALAGMAGGWTSTVLMRMSEFVLALPALYLVLAARAMLPLDMSFGLTAFVTAALIAAVTWPPLALGVRGLILQLQNAGYTEAARAMGGSPWHILRRHMLPALAPFALAQTITAAPLFILGDLILSFLNVGFQGSIPSWGTMLRSLTADPRVVTDFWWNAAPFGFVILTLFCLNSLAGPWRAARVSPLG